MHPTAEKLIDTVSEMLDGEHPHAILVDDVLSASGVSRGALYHHFGDFPGLIEATLLRRFAINVDRDTAAIRSATLESKTEEEYWQRIRALSAATQLPSRALVRAERARIMALAATNERFGQRLSVEQERLTNEMAGTIELAQIRGWVKREFDPHAIAVFLQSYSLGRIVDDIAQTHLDNERWVEMIDLVLLAMRAS